MNWKEFTIPYGKEYKRKIIKVNEKFVNNSYLLYEN